MRYSLFALVGIILATLSCVWQAPASLPDAQGLAADSVMLVGAQDTGVCPTQAVVICVAVTATPAGSAMPSASPTAKASPSASPTATRTPVGATPTQIVQTPNPTATPLATVPPSAGNLLRNAGFEFPYNYVRNADGHSHLLPANWQSFYCDGCPALRRDTQSPPRAGFNEPGLLMGRPEYKSASYQGTAGKEWREGATAAQWFCFSRTCDAGVYQTITVPPGATCTASAYVRSWSNYDSDIASELGTADDRANATWFILVHPSGGSDWKAKEVLVSRAFGYSDGIYDAWAQISFTFNVPAGSTQVTLFFENVRLWPIPNNDNYIDSAAVRCN